MGQLLPMVAGEDGWKSSLPSLPYPTSCCEQPGIGSRGLHALVHFPIRDIGVAFCAGPSAASVPAFKASSSSRASRWDASSSLAFRFSAAMSSGCCHRPTGSSKVGSFPPGCHTFPQFGGDKKKGTWPNTQLQLEPISARPATHNTAGTAAKTTSEGAGRFLRPRDGNFGYEQLLTLPMKTVGSRQFYRLTFSFNGESPLNPQL